MKPIPPGGTRPSTARSARMPATAPVHAVVPGRGDAAAAGRAAGDYTTAQSGPGRPPVVALPLDYSAFCQLHQDQYRAYAHSRLGSMRLAERAVADALGDLAVNWHQALASSAPAAVAWDLLGARVRAARRSPAVPSHADTLHRLLPALQADTALLKYRMMLTTSQSACLLGLDTSVVAGALAAARRALRNEPTEQTPRP